MLLNSMDKPVSNIFDDLFENELYQSNTKHGSDDSLKLIEQYLDEAPSLYVDSDSRNEAQQHSERGQPWRKGLWCLNEEASVHIEKTRTPLSTEIFVSPTELICNDYDSNRQPSTARENHQTDNAFSTNGSAASQHFQLHRSTYRDRTLLPSPTYAQISQEELDEPYQDWHQGFRDLHLRNYVGDDNEHGPRRLEYAPHVAAVKQHPTSSSTSRFPIRYHYPFQRTLHQDPSVYPETIRVGRTPHAYQSGETESDLTWNVENPHSSDGSQNSSQTHSSQAGLFRTSDTLWRDDMQQWPLRGTYGNGIVAPIPQRRAHGVFEQYDGWSHDEIQSPHPMPGEIGRAISHPPADMQRNEGDDSSQSRQYHPFTAFPTLPLRPRYTEYGDQSTSHQRYHSFSSSPSPSSTTSYPMVPHTITQSSPSRTGRSRRKSIHKVGPIRETTVLDPTMSPTRSLSRARSQSRSRPSHTRHRSASAKLSKSTKHSSAPVSMGFDFDFVNYTAQDSEKLMSDVAPSGSSKTRARREQEARDKRTRLNEAAIIAVREAGGNVRDLERRLAS